MRMSKSWRRGRSDNDRACAYVSVRRLHEGLQSLLSIRRIEARRRKASALWLRFSQSFASLRQRLGQARERSTIWTCPGLVER